MTRKPVLRIITAIFPLHLQTRRDSQLKTRLLYLIVYHILQAKPAASVLILSYPVRGLGEPPCPSSSSLYGSYRQRLYSFCRTLSEDGMSSCSSLYRSTGNVHRLSERACVRQRSHPVRRCMLFLAAEWGGSASVSVYPPLFCRTPSVRG